MSLHKITAGSGYDYLTRQVTVQDSTEKGHAGLASDYSQRGETPGVWMGSGVADLGDLNDCDLVTADAGTSNWALYCRLKMGRGQFPVSGTPVTDVDANIVGRAATEGEIWILTLLRSRSAPADLPDANDPTDLNS